MPQIFCMLDEGGRALVTKAQGDIQVPSFPTVGLLCSISTYGDNAGFSVETFGTTNVQIVYKRCVCTLTMRQLQSKRNAHTIASFCTGFLSTCCSCWPPATCCCTHNSFKHCCR